MWMHIDHLWSQLWVSRLAHYALAHCCSCHTRAYFYSLFGFLCEKKWSQEKSTENPSDILRFPFFIRDSLRAHRRYGLNFSLRAVCFFSFCSAKKNYKNSEPVTCASASTVPFRNTYEILEKKHIESFSQVDVTRSTFFGTFFQKTVSAHKGSQEARWTGASTMVMSEHDALS